MAHIVSWFSQHLWQSLGAFGIAFLASLCLTPLVIRVAHAKELIARPRAERWHAKPTALFGGVAIFVATAISAALFLPFNNSGVIALVVGATCIFLSGLYDDFKSLRPAQKVVPQLVVSCLFVERFYQDYPPALVWLVPFAILWIVGITNAINLLDNMDGLSSGVSMLVAVLMAAHAAWRGDEVVVVGALILAGAAGGFLVFNFNPARIFMGDCGSMFLGYSLACLSLMGSSGLLSGNLFTALLLPTLVLATPLFDTFFVAIVRFINGRPISLGGRDHTSHRLVLLGLSERRAVTWLYAITLWFGLLALYGSIYGNWLATATITLLSWVALLLLGLFLAEVETYSEEEYLNVRETRKSKTVLSRVIRYKRRLVETILDFAAICGSWIAAFLLRYEGNLGSHVREMGLLLPYIVACQMTAFYSLGLYRNLWRYVTIADLSALARAIFLGTLGAVVLIKCFAPVGTGSNTVVAIYAMLLLMVTGGLRIGLKALRFHFALKWRDGVRRVLVFGAGDAGELAVREMLNNKSLQLQPVAFLDDDPHKQRAAILGVRVVGTRHDLRAVVERLKVDEVIIAMPSRDESAVQEIARLCQRSDIECREIRGLIL